MSPASTIGAPPVLCEALGGLMLRYEPRDEPDRRRPGRPKKRTPEYLRSLLAQHVEIRAWFEHEFEEMPRSDRELYTQYFAHLFLTRGLRESRATEPAFQRKLKTTLNVLSEARRHFRDAPENGSISGMREALKC